MPKTKLDFKKSEPEFYKSSSKEASIVKVPSMTYFMIDGKGNPNTAQSYQDAIQCLYAVSYGLKMKIIKKEQPNKDYIVPPLEGLWYLDDMTEWSMENKDNWKWTMIIRIPDFATQDQIKRCLEIVKQTKNPSSLPNLRIESYHEGLSAQIMHLGPYSEEPSTIKALHEYIKEANYALRGKHHEIYLSDPRKAKPEKLKTIIRQPISMN